MVRRAISVLVPLASVCLLWACPASGLASAPPRFHHVATAAGVPVADGTRYVVFLASATRVRVLDTKLGLSTDADGPVGDNPYGSAQCLPESAGGGHLLWTCPDTGGGLSPRLLVQNLATGQFQSTPGLQNLVGRSYPPVRISQAGRYWLGGSATAGRGGPPAGVPLFYNLATGDVRFAAGLNHYGDHHVEDLAWPTLEHPLCAGLRRPRFQIPNDDLRGPQFVTAYERLDYQPPYALASPATASNSQWAGNLLLMRCGSRGATRLQRCKFWECSQITLGAGVVTWRSTDRLHAYVARTKQNITWSTGAAGVPGLRYGGGLTIVHTASQVFISYPNPTTGSNTTWTVRAATLPGT